MYCGFREQGEQILVFLLSRNVKEQKHWLPLPEFLLGKMKSSALKEVEISVN